MNVVLLQVTCLSDAPQWAGVRFTLPQVHSCIGTCIGQTLCIRMILPSP